MSKKSQTIVGGERGYSIQRVAVTDEKGNVISEYFELYDPDGNLIGTYSSLDEAKEVMDEEIDRQAPSPGM